MKRIIVSLLLFMSISIVFSACSNSKKVELTADNNTNIANIVRELKEHYSLSDSVDSEIIVRGNSTENDAIVNDGSISFCLYIDSGNWNNANEAVRYTFKRLAAMCGTDSLLTLNCEVYLNEDGYYVHHSINSMMYYDDKPEQTFLSITEFDSESIQEDYVFYRDNFNLSDHEIRENNGVKYKNAAFELKLDPTGVGRWTIYANLNSANDYTVDELIEIGEKVYVSLAIEAALYAEELNSFAQEKSYNIDVDGLNCSVRGKNSNSDTLVWESN